jgi:hypothetical protein
MGRPSSRGVLGALFVCSMTPAAAAQATAPGGSTSGPAPTATAAFGSTPAPAPSEASTSPPQAPGGAPAPAAPQTYPQYGGAQAAPPPQQGYPPPGYGAPQQYWGAPQYPPQVDQSSQAAEGASAPSTAPRLQRGPYFGGWLGVGAPFGGDTTIGPGAGYGYKEGVGVLGAAGWAFIPNFGLDAFIHYNRTSLALRPNDQEDFADDSGWGLFYGLEARGMVGAGPIIGWGSVGISLGTGSLTTRASRSPFGGGAPPENVGDVTFKPMPVLAFGAEIEVTRGLGIGPQARWYIVNVDSACMDSTEPNVTFDPNTGQTITNGTRTRTNCASNLSDITVPDILFVGVGLTYRLGI